MNKDRKNLFRQTLFIAFVMTLVVTRSAIAQGNDEVVLPEKRMLLQKKHEYFVSYLKDVKASQEVSFKVDEKKGIDRIFYGEKYIGFFVAKNWKVKDGKLHLQFIPPTFLHPIEIWGENSKSKQRWKLGQKQFRYPAWPRVFQEFPDRQGEGPVPFFLTNLGVGTGGGTLFYPAILNKFGEILWIYYRPEDSGYFLIAPTLKVLMTGEILIVPRRWQSALIKVNALTGSEMTEIPKQDAKLMFTHPVEIDEPQGRILAFVSECRELNYWNDESPVFQGLKGLWNYLRLPRRNVMLSRLVEFDLQSLKYKSELWRTDESFSLKRDLNLSMDSATMDKFLFVSTAEQYQEMWDENRSKLSKGRNNCDSEWLHENSLQYLPEKKGFLISMKDNNRIFFLDEKTKKVSWTLGSSPSDDFQLSYQQAFYQQHAAWMDSQDNIYLFDNAGASVGQRGLDLPTRILKLKLEKGGKKIATTKEFVFGMPFKQPLRGELVKLPLAGDKIFVYLPGVYGGSERYIVVDLDTNKFDYQLIFNRHFYNTNIRAVPLFALGADKLEDGAAATNGVYDPADEHKDQIINYSY